MSNKRDYVERPTASCLDVRERKSNNELNEIWLFLVPLLHYRGGKKRPRLLYTICVSSPGEILDLMPHVGLDAQSDLF